MPITTGLSGNEIYCLQLKNFTPGNIVVGNSVYSLGLLRSIGTGFKSIIGGELQHVTKLIEEGREIAYQRMLKEAQTAKATGITGVSSELIFHSGNIEFLSIGSMVFSNTTNTSTPFSTSANGQELFAQLDAGYQPICFAFGNVAYSMGIGRGFIGAIKTLARGEIKEYSDLYNRTRHLALERIIDHAKQHQANAVLGIKTTILPFMGTNEMLMIGTASRNPNLPTQSSQHIVTSDLTNIEMWNLASLGYAPLRLLLGSSVYSLGVVGGLTSVIKSFVRGEINELTRMIYDARENALALINDEAKAIGAHDVVGVNTYVYQLGGGLIEFLAIGTAVQKISNVKTESANLPAQAIIVDKSTFYSAMNNAVGVSTNSGYGRINRTYVGSIIAPIIIVLILVIYFLAKLFMS